MEWRLRRGQGFGSSLRSHSRSSPWLPSSVARIAGPPARSPQAHSGFSIDRPPNDQWYVNLSEAIQNPDAALYRRDVPNVSQSFGFIVRFFDLDREPTSNAEFAALFSHTPARGVSPDGATITSYETRAEALHGHSCIRFSMETAHLKLLTRKLPMKSVPLITRGMSLAAFLGALVLCFGFGLTQAEQIRAAQPVAHEPNAPSVLLPGFDRGDRPELQVLLSSIE